MTRVERVQLGSYYGIHLCQKCASRQQQLLLHMLLYQVSDLGEIKNEPEISACGLG